ncbi:unnamed protein product [Cyclocybe aegerita]|uniref:non-specific serine/threonine protein kinase n=1 Tax=Cyclocybe aegerita TaxID=1973307 RepID=A0A8S0W975_CYCAE|nr:unnamed protein product [Cyclocybe aegerita]
MVGDNVELRVSVSLLTSPDTFIRYLDSMKGRPLVALLLACATAMYETNGEDLGSSYTSLSNWWRPVSASFASRNLTTPNTTNRTTQPFVGKIAFSSNLLKIREGRTWDASSVPPFMGPESYKVIKIPHRYVALKPWGTRVFPSIQAYEDRVWSAAPTRVYGELPLVVETSTSLSLWFSTLCISPLFAVRLWTLKELLGAAKSSVGVFIGVLSVARPFALVFLRWLVFIVLEGLERGLRVSEICLTAFYSCIETWIQLYQLGLDKKRMKKADRLREECIQRKRPFVRTRRPAQHQQPALKETPLFSLDSSEMPKCKYLPEEIQMALASPSLHPLRDMYDPLMLRLVQQIGAGAFGCVMQVEHRPTGRAMALKKLVGRDNSEEDFESEVRAMVRLQGGAWYPELYGSFRDVDSFYILMPFYPKGDLYEVILAIQGLHQRGIIHRDLKPENILFKEDGHLVVADFGIAYVFEHEEDEFLEDEFPLWAEKKAQGGDDFPFLTPSVDNPHTTLGTYGTPFYAAPEVLRGLEYSYGVDYYSVAIIYHEMITGYVPLLVGSIKPGSGQPEVEVNLGRQYIHLQTVSAAERDFLEKMLHEDPFARLSVRQIKSHPIFSGLDWSGMAKLAGPIPRPPALRKRVALGHSTLCSDLADD